MGSDLTNGDGGQRIQAEQLFLNKLYLYTTDGYDIGLIKLKTEAVLGIVYFLV